MILQNDNNLLTLTKCMMSVGRDDKSVYNQVILIKHSLVVVDLTVTPSKIVYFAKSVIVIEETAVAVCMKGVVVTNCSSRSVGGVVVSARLGMGGGAMEMTNSSLTNVTCELEGGCGGAIYCYLTSKNNEFNIGGDETNGVSFSNCSVPSSSGYGGGIYLHLPDDVSPPPRCYLLKGNITFNNCTASCGNHIYISSPTLDTVCFQLITLIYYYYYFIYFIIVIFVKSTISTRFFQMDEYNFTDENNIAGSDRTKNTCETLKPYIQVVCFFFFFFFYFHLFLYFFIFFLLLFYIKLETFFYYFRKLSLFIYFIFL
jgi:hypothetical protein